MEILRPHEHWTAAIEPLLRALEPRQIWAPGNDRLSVLAGDLSGGSASPGESTDAVVISGDPNHHFVASCLNAALTTGVGGDLGPPLLVVAGTGWPHGDRDGYRDPSRVPAAQRRAYARCLPDPDKTWLSAEPGPLACALEPGGEPNGVRGAVDAVLANGGWRARFLEGFGGAAVLAAEARLALAPRLAEAFGALGGSAASDATLRRLDLDLGRGMLARARLERGLSELQTRDRELSSSLAAALDELDRELAGERGSIRNVSDGLADAASALSAAERRAKDLEHRLVTSEAQAASARASLLEERTWVAQQARVIGRSQAWRVGHRLARTARLLTLRRDRGTNAVERIVDRMERGLEPSGHH